MLSPEEEQRLLAQQALQQRAGNPGATGTPMVNATQGVAAQSALPPSALEGASTGPGWANYLGGMQQVQQGSPAAQPGALPFPGGTKTQRRIEFEESVRQYNEQMAFRRAVEAANQAARARAERKSAEGGGMDPKSAIWGVVKGVVEDAVKQGRGWSYVNQYLVSQYGNFPKEAPFADIQSAAGTYYTSLAYPDSPWEDTGVQEPVDRRLTNLWQFWKKDPEPTTVENREALWEAFYGDTYREK